MRAFDPVSLQSVASEVVAAGIRAGLSMSGVIPRPKLTRLYTVLRSPHIDKKARDQFHMIVRWSEARLALFMLTLVLTPLRFESRMFQEAPCHCEIRHSAGAWGFPGSARAGEIPVYRFSLKSLSSCGKGCDTWMQVDKKGVDLNIKRMS
jgi:hypothetical protein